MGKYEKLAKDIIQNIGGKDNVADVFHCITRLRFTLKDEKKANDAAFKNMDGVVTLMKSGGYYQVVIGNHVPDVFKEVIHELGFSKDIPVEKGKDQRKFSEKALDLISAIFVPFIAVLAASGMIKGVNTLLDMGGIVSASSGLGILLAAIGDTLFYYLPVFVAYTFGTKIGLNKFLALASGLAMVYPTITGIPEATMIFGVNVAGLSYASTVLPVVAVVVVGYYLQQLFNKIIPDVVKSFLTPMLVLMIAVPVGYVFMGPVANSISNGLYGVVNGLINSVPVLGGAVVAFFWQILVIFGVHQALIVPSIIGLAQGAQDSFIAMLSPAPFAQMAVVFAMWLKTKDKRKKSLQLPAWISGIFGVTEPAIYGFTLPNMKLFLAGCVAAAAGGAYIGLTNTKIISMAGLGVFTIPGVIDPNNSSNLLNFLIGCAISIVLAIVFTLILFKEKENTIDEKAASKAPLGKSGTVKQQSETVVSPMQGTVINLSEIKDAAFAEGALGQGLAVIPTSGEVVAPVDGTISAIFPTKHALGIVSDQGAEILIHIGLNTVELNGEYFDLLVNQGDKVKKGQLIMKFDLKSVKKMGYDLTTPVVITNTKDYLDVVGVAEDSVERGAKLIELLF